MNYGCKNGGRGYARSARYSAGRRQNGAVLIIGLILLVVMAMIGMTGMQTTTQQERMAGNLRDRNAGFQSAETALRAGESEVKTGIVTGLGNGYYDSSEGVPAPTDGELADDSFWTVGNSKVVAAVHGTAAPPSYKIEKRPPVREDMEAGAAKTKEIFKVTARGVGASASAVVVVQSTFSP